MNDEALFSFNIDPLLDGIGKVGAGFDRMQSSAKALGQSVSKSLGSAVNGLILKIGALFAAFKSVGAVLREMPEVGEAFGVAKDVFLKNLLWPLRQQVMPMLQSMLDWVRDNRAQFVKWGVTVANVFRAGAVAARTLWDVFKGLAVTMGDTFQRAFKTNFKTFDEFVNVLSFKVSAVIVYMGLLAKQTVSELRPAFDWVVGVASDVIGFFVDLASAWASANSSGDSLWTVMDSLGSALSKVGTFVASAVKGFREGLVPAVSEVMTPIGSLFDSLDRILNVLGVGDDQGVRGAFKKLGSFLGTTFQVILSTIAGIADGLAGSLEAIKAAAEAVGSLFKGDLSGASKAGRAFVDMTTAGQTGSLEEAYSVFSGEVLQDGVVTKGGRVIRISEDDNVIAMKADPLRAMSAMRSEAAAGGFQPVPQQSARLDPPQMSVGPFYVTVPEGSDGRREGEAVGRAAAETLRQKISSSRNREGF